MSLYLCLRLSIPKQNEKNEEMTTNVFMNLVRAWKHSSSSPSLALPPWLLFLSATLPSNGLVTFYNRKLFLALSLLFSGSLFHFCPSPSLIRIPDGLSVCDSGVCARLCLDHGGLREYHVNDRDIMHVIHFHFPCTSFLPPSLPPRHGQTTGCRGSQRNMTTLMFWGYLPTRCGVLTSTS